MFTREICQMEGFWFLAHLMESTTAFRLDFQPRSDDVLVTSSPQNGDDMAHGSLSQHPSPRQQQRRRRHSDEDEPAREAVRNSGCKIVHVTRNPKDTLVSMWNIFNMVLKRDPTATDLFPMEGSGGELMHWGSSLGTFSRKCGELLGGEQEAVGRGVVSQV
ncbi:unnamed protein product [Linum tenue]|uniref:Sulfotransferase n=1 Tax=Linum tenue TaxID=586396 RepID=A0AAV0LWA3_9ROSI|nr:unnamed protein product [Linum tenue]